MTKQLFDPVTNIASDGFAQPQPEHLCTDWLIPLSTEETDMLIAVKTLLPRARVLGSIKRVWILKGGSKQVNLVVILGSKGQQLHLYQITNLTWLRT
jgi:hypothetical protein